MPRFRHWSREKGRKEKKVVVAKRGKRLIFNGSSGLIVENKQDVINKNMCVLTCTEMYEKM